MDYTSKLILLPALPGDVGGPGTFSLKFSGDCESRGIKVEWGTRPTRIPDAILLISATRRLLWLSHLRQMGTTVVQRLDGYHAFRLQGSSGFSLRDSWKIPIQNRMIAFIRRSLAHSVVYQSHSARYIWSHKHGIISKDEHIIHNATDTSLFQPINEYESEPLSCRILCVEGTFPDDHGTLAMLDALCQFCVRKCATLTLVGYRTKKHDFLRRYHNVELLGPVPRSEMPAVYRKHHIYVSLERNAACPNALIEAMSSGLPVVGFRWGALPELTDFQSAVLAEVGCDPWSMDLPDIPAFLKALEDCVSRRSTLAKGARRRAVQHFNISETVDAYLRVLLPKAL